MVKFNIKREVVSDKNLGLEVERVESVDNSAHPKLPQTEEDEGALTPPDYTYSLEKHGVLWRGMEAINMHEDQSFPIKRYPTRHREPKIILKDYLVNVAEKYFEIEPTTFK